MHVYYTLYISTKYYVRIYVMRFRFHYIYYYNVVLLLNIT